VPARCGVAGRPWARAEARGEATQCPSGGDEPAALSLATPRCALEPRTWLATQCPRPAQHHNCTAPWAPRLASLKARIAVECVKHARTPGADAWAAASAAGTGAPSLPMGSPSVLSSSLTSRLCVLRGGWIRGFWGAQSVWANGCAVCAHVLERSAGRRAWCTGRAR